MVNSISGNQYFKQRCIVTTHEKKKRRYSLGSAGLPQCRIPFGLQILMLFHFGNHHLDYLSDYIDYIECYQYFFQKTIQCLTCVEAHLYSLKYLSQTGCSACEVIQGGIYYLTSDHKKTTKFHKITRA